MRLVVTKILSTLLVCCLCALPGCAPLDAYDEESPWVEGEVGTWRVGLTVGQAGGCSTSIVNALSQQLIDEINCLRPNTLVDFTGPNMSLGNAVWPYLQGQGPQDLQAAINRQGQRLTINSALRTLPQQFLLYKWYQAGQCGIALAARPGRSRHESGLAIDISNNAAWRQSLEAHNFNWLGASDPVHFDYAGEGIVSLAGLSVRAFQRLWNRNHPEDEIEEDGLYGPQTEGRLLQSPAEGFAIGGCMVDDPARPDRAPPPPVDMAHIPPRPDAAIERDFAQRPQDMLVDAETDTRPTDLGRAQDAAMNPRLDVTVRRMDRGFGQDTPPQRTSRQTTVNGAGGCTMTDRDHGWHGFLLATILLGIPMRRRLPAHRP